MEERGAYGIVRLCKYNERHVAVKEMRRVSYTKELVRKFCREVLLSSDLNHENIVTLLGVAMTQPTLSLVYEYCNMKSLRYLLFQRDDIILTTMQKLQFALHIARGMEYMHYSGIVHRDLKVCINTNTINTINFVYLF